MPFCTDQLIIIFIHICRWVVTAAHCIDGESGLGLVAGGVGEGHFTVGFKIPLANQFIHPDYDTTTHINDIGLYLIATAN